MKKQYLALNKDNTIVCKGTVEGIKKYLKQLDIRFADLLYVNIVDSNNVFDDFNIILIEDINLYLLEGQYDIIVSEIDDEKYAFEYMTKSIKEALESNIFSDENIERLQNIAKELEYVKKEHSEYLKQYFSGIDKAALVNLTLTLYNERNKVYLPNQVNIEL